MNQLKSALYCENKYFIFLSRNRSSGNIQFALLPRPFGSSSQELAIVVVAAFAVFFIGYV